MENGRNFSAVSDTNILRGAGLQMRKGRCCFYGKSGHLLFPVLQGALAGVFFEGFAVIGGAGEAHPLGNVFHGKGGVPQKGQGSFHPAGIHESPQGAAVVPVEGFIEDAFGMPVPRAMSWMERGWAKCRRM